MGLIETGEKRVLLDFFPEGYEPRDSQKQFLQFIEKTRRGNNLKRFKVAMLPTALGKSFLAKTLMDYNTSRAIRTAVTTPQNLLIDQYLRDFPEMPNLKGQTNYPCMKYGDGTVHQENSVSYFDAREAKLCTGCGIVCPYIEAKCNVELSFGALFNPLSFMFSRFSCETLIVDEAHGLSDMLLGTYETRIWQRDVNWDPTLGQNVPKLMEKMAERLGALLTLAKRMVEAVTLAGSMSMKIRKELAKLNKQINSLKRVVEDFEYEHENLVVEFCQMPYRNVMEDCFYIRAAKLPQKVFKSIFPPSIKEIILLSGTILPHTLDEMRIDPKDCAFFEAPSPIPAKNRKFYATNRVKNSWDPANSNIPAIAQHILEIAEIYPNERGFVLATYSQAELLKPLLCKNPRFSFHKKEDKKDAYKEFLANPSPNCIGLFSGMSEGADLKNDLARFCILTKMIYPNLKDNVVKRRMSQNPRWYGEATILQTIQGAGRIVRNESDFGTIFMLDSNFSMTYAQNKNACPNYFREAVEHCAGVTSFSTILSQARKEYEEWQSSRIS